MYIGWHISLSRSYLLTQYTQIYTLLIPGLRYALFNAKGIVTLVKDESTSKDNGSHNRFFKGFVVCSFMKPKKMYERLYIKILYGRYA